MIGVGLGLASILLGLRPRLAAWPLALTAAAALLYRDPERHTPDSRGLVIAPADGAVLAVDEQYEHRYLHTDAVRITIDTSPLDVPVQRSPADGTVSYLEHVSGAYRPPWHLRGRPSAECERQYIGIEADWGPLLIGITAGPLARGIRCRVEIGDRLEAGDRVATVRFGARVELLLPRDIVESLPVPGAQLVAGVSRLGHVVPL